MSAVDPSGTTGAGELSVAVYEREIRASIERVWENVDDWEHLPSLHARAFSAVRLLDSAADFWRVEAVLAGEGEPEARTSLIELRTERSSSRYTTRTLEGAGAGSRILTHLTPLAEHRTAIRVEFFVTGVEPEHGPLVGDAYKALYTELWDEDERMMRDRQAFLDRRATAASTDGRLELLGSVAEFEARLPMIIDDGRARFRIDRVGTDPVVFSAVCPHMGAPLDDAVIEDGVVVCPWHGYRFDVRCRERRDRPADGSTGGAKLSLARAPELDIDRERDRVTLDWSSVGARKR